VRDGETGYLVEFDNPSMLADRVKALLDEQVRSRCSRNIKKLARKYFGWDGIIDEYVKMYQDLV
ncbi:MAG: glycosyltransferase, partial [Deltaproteobacteria bacterium]|nr:glycosyltransferase [Deltaproteobacteria bacterium]